MIKQYILKYCIAKTLIVVFFIFKIQIMQKFIKKHAQHISNISFNGKAISYVFDNRYDFHKSK